MGMLLNSQRFYFIIHSFSYFETHIQWVGLTAFPLWPIICPQELIFYWFIYLFIKNTMLMGWIKTKSEQLTSFIYPCAPTSTESTFQTNHCSESCVQHSPSFLCVIYHYYFNFKKTHDILLIKLIKLIYVMWNYINLYFYRNTYCYFLNNFLWSSIFTPKRYFLVNIQFINPFCQCAFRFRFKDFAMINFFYYLFFNTV